MIRKFQPTDLEAILELFHDTVHAIASKYYSSEQVHAWAPANGVDKEQWLQSLTANLTFVAEDQGKIIGFGDMTKTGFIDRLYVHKDYQRSGVASAILKRFEKEARKLGVTELTTEASILLKPLAGRQGFEVVQENKKVRRGVEFITYFMRKKL
jgi:putative acetyltransferase